MVCPIKLAEVMYEDDSHSYAAVAAAATKALVEAISTARRRGLLPGLTCEEYEKIVDRATTDTGIAAVRLLGWRLG